MKQVSLIILTRDRAAALLQCVERALALPERAPVIVVDNGSTDGTPCVLKARFPQVKLVRVPFDIGPAARNLGVQCAETPYVAFSDEDTAWSPGALQSACGLLDFYPRLGVLSARVGTAMHCLDDSLSARMAGSPLPSNGLPGPALLSLRSDAAVLRRAAFLDAGGYEPRLDFGADALLAFDIAAAGWRLCYAPQVAAGREAAGVAARADRATRRGVAREALWVAWLRRPLERALALTLQFVRETPSPSALGEAFAGAAWIFRERRVVPAAVEALCRAVEAQPVRPPRFGGLPRPA